ncbi:MAG: WD40 repeat domain-containing protein [Alphaproteobacteria bacterium]|nr:MAG: WD40 repeat domain-containing protein [Alphaproteobacteria bacterium]
MIDHRGPIHAITGFRDSLLATAGADGRVILWNAHDDVALARGCHDDSAYLCGFSGSGNWLISAGADFSARLWSVPDLRLRAVMAGHEDAVEAAAFHPTLERVATAARDGSVIVFDFAGRPLLHLAGHNGPVVCLLWLKGGGELVALGEQGIVSRWDAENGQRRPAGDIEGAFGRAAAASPDGTFFAGTADGAIILLCGRRRERFEAHRGPIADLSFDPASGALISIGMDRSVKVWSRSGGSLTCTADAKLPPLVAARAPIFVGPDRLAFPTFGSRYGTLDLKSGTWDLEDIEPAAGFADACHHEGALFTISEGGILASAGRERARLNRGSTFIVSHEGRLVCGGDSGGLVDALSGELLWQQDAPLLCACTVEGGRLAIGTAAGEMLMFEAEGDSLRPVAALRLHRSAITGIASDAGLLFTVTAAGSDAAHRLETMEEVHSDPSVHSGGATGCTALPGGRFASVGRDLKLRLWGLDRSVGIATAHRNAMSCCAASADGTHLATGDEAGRVGIFDLRSGEYLRFVRLSSEGISSLAAAPEPGAFIATSRDGYVYHVTGPTARCLLAA